MFEESGLYRIKISDRVNGYYTCTFNILSDDEVLLLESSGKKILQRLGYVFSLSWDKLPSEHHAKIITILRDMAKALKVREDFVDDLLNKYW